jgi:hypothetical protein
MEGIRAQDRTYFHGHWNGSIRIAAGVAGIQIEKLRRIFS